MGNKAAIFLDRDGTLIKETNYLLSVEQISVFENSFEAVRRINSSGLLAIVVTNQSAVARGLLSEQQLATIHRSLRIQFSRNGAKLDAIHYCPHHPSEGSGINTRQCKCRKPNPGMLIQAASEFGLDLTQSVLIGDKLVDVETGQRAGTGSVLVKTGYGEETATKLENEFGSQRPKWYPDHIASDILQAVNWSLERTGERSSS